MLLLGPRQAGELDFATIYTYMLGTTSRARARHSRNGSTWKRLGWRPGLSRGALRPRGRVARGMPEVDQAALVECPAGRCANAGELPFGREPRAPSERGRDGNTDVHHGRAPRVDPADDLLNVDALQLTGNAPRGRAAARSESQSRGDRRGQRLPVCPGDANSGAADGRVSSHR